jgi:hypothetical protein
METFTSIFRTFTTSLWYMLGFTNLRAFIVTDAYIFHDL